MLATGTIDAALSVNWRGAPDRWLIRLGLRLFDSQAVHGIPGSVPDYDGVPYSLTEEFVTVYRMHPLIPDDYIFVDHNSGDVRHRAEFRALQGRATEPLLRKIGLVDTLYSLGIANPGAVQLHNFPRSLQRFERDGEILDLSGHRHRADAQARRTSVQRLPGRAAYAPDTAVRGSYDQPHHTRPAP